MRYGRNYLLRLAGCGARKDTAPGPEEDVDWKDMMREASNLKVMQFAAGAVMGCREEICPAEVKRRLVGEVIEQAVRYHYGLKMVSELQEGLKRRGIASAVMKGYALSAAYPVPELRMGQDVDLYVDPGQEKKAISWLTANGWRVALKRGWCSNHSELKRDDFGILELHTKFHSRYAGIYYRNRRLEKGVWRPSEPFARMETEDGAMDVLSVNDHFTFICVHMIRHLLEGEVTVRMILDTAAFLDAYRDHIEWSRTWEIMEALKCVKLFSTVLACAETYFGYSFQDMGREEIAPEDQERLMEFFCDSGDTSPYDKMRLRYEYNNMAGTGSVECLTYRLFALSCYFEAFGRRIEKYGVPGYLREGMKKVRELTGGGKGLDQTFEDNKTQRSDEVLLLLKDMGVL